MTAERLAKNFERMVITSERQKKFSNGRPERLNGRSKISNGWCWTAERLVKNFERMVITAERIKKISNGRPEQLNGSSKISNGWSCRWSQAQAVDVLVGRAKNFKFWLAYFKIISLTSTLPEKYRLETFQFFGCPFAHGHYFLCTHTGFTAHWFSWFQNSLNNRELSWKVCNNYDLPERSIPFSFDKDIISMNSSFIFSAQYTCKKKNLKLFLISNVYFNDRTCILD